MPGWWGLSRERECLAPHGLRTRPVAGIVCTRMQKAEKHWVRLCCTGVWVMALARSQRARLH